MIRELIFIAGIGISINANANGTTTTQIDPYTYGQQNHYTEIFSKHSYTVTNDTSSIQNIQVCYSIIACQEYPVNTQSTFSCDKISLSSGQTKSDSKNIDLKAVFKAYGWCNTQAVTEIKGWIYQVSRSNGKLQVNP